MQNHDSPIRQKKHVAVVGVLVALAITLTVVLALDSLSTGPVRDWPVQGRDQLLYYAFTDPIITGELLHEPITSLDGILEANESIFIEAQAFYDAYDKLQLLDTELLLIDEGETEVLRVNYMLSGMLYDAYAYYVRQNASHSSDRAALIIPGSGTNQASSILYRDPSNYHYGIMDTLGGVSDVFVLIKPNEDILAFHDGQGKLNADFVVNWQLNRGSSYSVRYIVDSLAITKHLKQEYSSAIVAGLSQGGIAALLNALQSQPQKAVISSGYAVLLVDIEWAGHVQIIIPGVVEKVLRPDLVLSAIQDSSTSFFFSYGREEVGIYKVEADERLTCRYLDAANVTCVTHDGGHVFPSTEIMEFLGITE